MQEITGRLCLIEVVLGVLTFLNLKVQDLFMLYQEHPEPNVWH